MDHCGVMLRPHRTASTALLTHRAAFATPHDSSPVGSSKLIRSLLSAQPFYCRRPDQVRTRPERIHEQPCEETKDPERGHVGTHLDFTTPSIYCGGWIVPLSNCEYELP